MVEANKKDQLVPTIYNLDQWTWQRVPVALTRLVTVRWVGFLLGNDRILSS